MELTVGSETEDKKDETDVPAIKKVAPLKSSIS